jgi:hypothetical protein
MQISRISDGAHEGFDISSYDTLDSLLAGISDVLGIPVDGLVVFLGGRVLDEVVWGEVWERSGAHGRREGGDGWSGAEEERGLFVFDREAFSSDPEEWVKGLEEDVILDIELPREPPLSTLFSSLRSIIDSPALTDSLHCLIPLH